MNIYLCREKLKYWIFTKKELYSIMKLQNIDKEVDGMKKRAGILCLTGALALSFAVFIACSGGGKTEGNKSEGDKTDSDKTYKISVTDDAEFKDYYDVALSAQESKVGETVTATVEDKFGFLDPTAYFNGTACTEGAADGEFTFAMPSSDVTLTLEFGIDDVEENNGMKWGLTPPLTAGSGQIVEFTVTFGTTYVSNSTYATSAGELGMTYIRLLSTNEEVFPPKAVYRIRPIETGAPYASAVGATIIINCANVSKGTTKLIFLDKQNNRAITYNLTVE